MTATTPGRRPRPNPMPSAVVQRAAVRYVDAMVGYAAADDACDAGEELAVNTAAAWRKAGSPRPSKLWDAVSKADAALRELSATLDAAGDELTAATPQSKGGT